jgi:hypothetical protein
MRGDERVDDYQAYLVGLDRGNNRLDDRTCDDCAALVCSAMIIFCLTSSVEEKPPFDLGPVNLVVQDSGHDASLQFL